MHGAAADLVATRRHPVHPELMQSHCQILTHLYENDFAPCAHGLSTTMMAACFHADFLVQNLSHTQHIALMEHTRGLKLMSSHDRLWRPEPVRSESDDLEGTEVDQFLHEFDDETQAGSTESASPPPTPSPPPAALLLPFSQRLSFGGRTTPKKSTRSTWSKEEDDFVLKFFVTHGASWRLMSTRLAETVGTDRSDDALRNRHSRLCCNTKIVAHSRASDEPARRSWTAEEDQIIAELVSGWINKATWRLITKRFVGRTAHSIRNRASRLYMHSERLRSVTN